MPLTPTGWGRVRTKCEKCEHWVVRTGDKWPHCEARETRVALDYEFLNGPESNCPAGRWAGVEPVDLPKTAAEQREAAIAATATRTIHFLKSFGATIPDKQADIEAELAKLVTDGILAPTVAAKIEEDLLAEKEAAAREL